MSWAQRDAERMEDRADEVTRLESALAAMTAERDGLTCQLSRYAEELESMTAERDGLQGELARRKTVENACDQFPCSALKNTCETCPDP